MIVGVRCKTCGHEGVITALIGDAGESAVAAKNDGHAVNLCARLYAQLHVCDRGQEEESQESG